MRGDNPGSWVALWRMVTRLQAEKINPWLALRNSIGVALPLAVGAATGAAPVGLAVSTGALNVSFSDSSEPYTVRAWRMLAASVLVLCAVAAGEMCGRNHSLAVAITMGWAFAAGLLVALGSTAADLGTISLVTLVVYAAAPNPPERALIAGLLALGGGLLQASLSLALWPVRRYAPERRVLGELYLELSRSADAPIQATAAPPASRQSTEARQSLAAAIRDHSVEAERLRALLSQAERIRLSLMLLGRLRIRMHREREGSPACESLDRYFVTAARMLGEIGRALLAGRRAGAADESLRELDALAESLRQAHGEPSSSMPAMLVDARRQMDALTGQLRSAVDLAAYSTPEGVIEFARRESRQPWSLRLIGTVATLRANLTLDSAACRHAIRLAVCTAAGDALARGFGLPRSYWLPMTIAIVLKPDFSATFSRGVLRLAGTFSGLVFATALFHVLPQNIGLEIALIFAAMFVLRCFGGANYGIFVLAVTALVVLLFAVNGANPATVIMARGLNTALGGAIALIAYALWPTWERSRVPEMLAQLLDAYRGYFHVVQQAYLHPDQSFAGELDRVRQTARLARSNLEASVDRLIAEPGAAPDILGTLSGMLANSHRLVHAIMALEAGLYRSRPVPAREMFTPFANGVELTLYYLAAALRGSRVTRDQLPDLREAHHALTQSGDPLSERYALVNVETDRVTNSLNTLAGEFLNWLNSTGV